MTDVPTVTPAGSASVTEKVSGPVSTVRSCVVLTEKVTIWRPASRAAPLVLVAVRVTVLETGSVLMALRVMPLAAVMLLAISAAKSVPSVAPIPAVSREKEKLCPALSAVPSSSTA
jgi:hypothetical protein